MIEFHDHKAAGINKDRNPYEAYFDGRQCRFCLYCCCSNISADLKDQTKKCGTDSVTDLVSEAAGTVYKSLCTAACFPLTLINGIGNHSPHGSTAAMAFTDSTDHTGNHDDRHGTA